MKRYSQEELTLINRIMKEEGMSLTEAISLLLRNPLIREDYERRVRVKDRSPRVNKVYHIEKPDPLPHDENDPN